MAGKAPSPPPSRREEIIAVARRLFVEHGYANVSTRLIARAAGISQPTLYSHFESKSQLVEEICWRWFEVLRERLAKAGAAHATPAHRLKRICRAYVELAWEEPDQYYIAFILPNDLGVERPLTAQFRAAGQRAYQELKNAVEPLASSPRHAETLAQSLWCALHGLAALVEWRPLFGWVDRNRLLDQHLELLCKGVGE